jgi:hypothetical protein
MTAPFGLLDNPPEGAGNRREIRLLTETILSALTHALIFGKLCLLRTEIPGFVPDSTARHWRAFLFLGSVFLSEQVDDAANQNRAA